MRGIGEQKCIAIGPIFGQKADCNLTGSANARSVKSNRTQGVRAILYILPGMVASVVLSRRTSIAI